jgi:hypothetical protein
MRTFSAQKEDRATPHNISQSVVFEEGHLLFYSYDLLFIFSFVLYSAICFKLISRYKINTKMHAM